MKHIKRYEGFFSNIKSKFIKEVKIDANSIIQIVEDTLLGLSDLAFNINIKNINSKGQQIYSNNLDILSITIQKSDSNTQDRQINHDMFSVSDIKSDILFLIDLLIYDYPKLKVTFDVDTTRSHTINIKGGITESANDLLIELDDNIMAYKINFKIKLV